MKRTDDILKGLTTEDKIKFTSGKESWYTHEKAESGIAKITMHDGPHGVKAGAKDAVIIPNLCLLACSFDRENAFKAGEILGNDCAKYGVDVLLAPGINIKRTPVGGRNFEYFSEDGCLSGELAASYVKGVQKNGTSATVKHFCCNNQDNYRMSGDSVVSEKKLFDTYLKQFYKVIKTASPDCVMTSYNKINGEKSNESCFLQKEVLRKKFGFKGVIMSDWGAVTNKIAALEAGCDLEMPGGADQTKELKAALKKGALNEDRLNEAAKNVIRLIKKHETKSLYNALDEREILSDIVSESIVMLKNDGVLPLKNGEKIGVFGKTALNPVIQGGGCAQVAAEKTSIPLDILKAGFEVVYTSDLSEIFAFLSCDKVLVFAEADSHNSEGYDRKNICVRKGDIEAANEIAKINKNTCLIMQNGGAVDFSPVNAGAILECYYGGTYFADGLMKILKGKSPSGRLAETFPLCAENSPSYLSSGEKEKIVYAEGDFVGYKYYCKKKIPVGYPFGYGLSYAEIRYNSFKLNGNAVTAKSGISGEIEIENLSEIPAKEVIQIYFSTEETKKLVYFDKVALQPKEKKTVSFAIDNFEFTKYDGKKYSLPREKGELVLAKDSLNGVFSEKIEIIPEKPIKITENSLIEDVYRLYGTAVVKKYFEQALGLAVYADPNRKFAFNDENFLQDDFERSVCLMMPLKNLVSFSLGRFSAADLKNAVKEINSTK